MNDQLESISVDFHFASAAVPLLLFPLPIFSLYHFATHIRSNE